MGEPLQSQPGRMHPAYGSTDYVRLQQELIALRTRLDRQIAQLTRLNRLSNTLLSQQLGSQGLETFAETIPDVLDMAIGVAWELSQREVMGMAAFGLDLPEESLGPLGLELLERLEAAGGRTTIHIDAASVPQLAGLDLCDLLVCRCINSDGECIGVVMAANTVTLAGMFDPISEETLAVLTQVAERFAALFDYRRYHDLLDHRQQLQESEDRLQRVLQGTNDGWWDWDLRTNRCLLSSRWITMLGGETSAAGLQDGFWLDRVDPGEREDFERTLQQTLEGEGEQTLEQEVHLRRDDGSLLPVLVRGRVSRDASGSAVRFAGTILDLSERKRHEAHVHRLAFYDSLTELPNRRALMDELPRRIQRCQASGARLAVLMIDLDGFKRLNDSHGHAAGDQLLQVVGQRLRAGVRSCDIVARLGGDEFVVVLEAIGHSLKEAQRHALQVAQGLLSRIASPYELDVGVSHHGASIGLAVLDQRSCSSASLLQHADMALYQAKASGRGQVRLFEPALLQRATCRARLEQQLRLALQNDQLELHYQAIVNRRGRLCGAEALLRWPRPGEAPVPPEEFIPVAEESGLIHPLGEWTLGRIAGQLQQWQGQLSDDFRISWNLSASEFLNPEFAERMLARIRTLGIEGRRLRLEITEATVLHDLGRAAERMDQLRSQGLEFSLDDFGTGYSSISYLRQLPLAEVKLDKSYIQSFLHERHDAAIVQAVLTLCGSLQIQLLAEGIETEDQWKRLHRYGCNRFQGFLFGRPMPPAAQLGGLLSLKPGTGGAKRTSARRHAVRKLSRLISPPA